MVDGKVAGRTPIAIRLTDRRIRFITEKSSPTSKTRSEPGSSKALLQTHSFINP
jgi:hypothetical protein